METYITTSIFRHRASIVGKRAALLWLSRRGWPIWIAIIVLLFLGMAVSPLFYLVGLMAAFLVFPTVMMLAYYHYMLSPEARKAILPQSIYFGNESFTVNYLKKESLIPFGGIILAMTWTAIPSHPPTRIIQKHPLTAISKVSQTLEMILK